MTDPKHDALIKLGLTSEEAYAVTALKPGTWDTSSDDTLSALKPTEQDLALVNTDGPDIPLPADIDLTTIVGKLVSYRLRYIELRRKARVVAIENGMIRFEDRTFLVQPGDVVHFKVLA